VALTIDATAGGSAANSFVTLAEAASYLEARLNTTTWDAADTDTQNRALVEATREVSNKEFIGQRSTDTQALSWPRWNATNPDSPTGWLYASDVVPDRVKNATIELAFQFVNAGTTDLASVDSNAGVIEKTVDVLTTRWSEYRRPTGMARFPRVLDYLRPLLCGSSSSVPLIRG
jgi:hypothetical protein